MTVTEARLEPRPDGGPGSAVGDPDRALRPHDAAPRPRDAAPPAEAVAPPERRGMSWAERWLLHLSAILVGGTGVVYAWMRYFAEPTDPFSVVNHPLQPTLQHLHILVAPLLVFGAGFIWRDHVWKHWERRVPGRRRSGVSMMLTLVPMVVSGYLIQTTVSAEWRSIWVGVHLVTSGLWAAAYLGHLVSPWLRRRRRRAAAGAPGPAA